MSLLVSTLMMATLVVAPFYLSRALALDAARVGAVMSAGPLVAAVAGVPAGRIVDRYGAQQTTLMGLMGMGIGASLLCMSRPALGLLGYLLPSAVSTASYALFQAANNTAAMTNVAPNERGLVSGMLNLARNLGLITGATVMGAVYAFASAASDVTRASPDAAAAGMRATFAVGTLLVIGALGVGIATLGAARRSGPSQPGQAA
jgi:MFS family permease